MAVFVNDAVRDKGLELFGTIASIKLVVCAGVPASFTEANTTYDGTAGKKKTGEVALASGDFTLGAGSPDGRQVVVSAKSVPISFTGATPSTDHAVILDVTNSRILAYSGFTGKSVGSGDTLNVGSWHIRIAEAEAE